MRTINIYEIGDTIKLLPIVTDFCVAGSDNYYYHNGISDYIGKEATVIGVEIECDLKLQYEVKFNDAIYWVNENHLELV